MRIDELNEMIRTCKKCRLYKTRKNAVCGEGNLNAKIMLIAQAPGEKEDEEGKMFVGASGKILDEMLKIVGISREDIYMTNLIKCMLPKYRKPKKDEIKTCAYYLDKEIELIKPKVLVPLGYYATKYIFEKYDIPVPLKKMFHSVCGKLSLGNDEKILPLPHPASLIYNIEFKQDMMKKYGKLKILLEDCKWYSVCPMRRFYEKGYLDKKWVELYCKGDWESCIRYKMEKEGKYHPDWMLPDGTMDEKLRKLMER